METAKKFAVGDKAFIRKNGLTEVTITEILDAKHCAYDISERQKNLRKKTSALLTEAEGRKILRSTLWDVLESRDNLLAEAQARFPGVLDAKAFDVGWEKMPFFRTVDRSEKSIKQYMSFLYYTGNAIDALRALLPLSDGTFSVSADTYEILSVTKKLREEELALQEVIFAFEDLDSWRKFLIQPCSPWKWAAQKIEAFIFSK